MIRRPVLAVLPFLALLAVIAPSLPAQEDAGFQNLQVLPKDVSRDELKAVMEGFGSQLGVRCTFCHVPDEYHKDDLSHKKDARRMLKLVEHLRANKELYFAADLDEARISCGLCHRGQAEPEPFVPE